MRLCVLLPAIIALFQPLVADSDLDGHCSKDNPDKCPKLQRKSSRAAYADLKKALEGIRKSCGEVCDTRKTGYPGRYYDVIEKKVDCEALFANEDIDKPAEFEDPPTKPPKWLLDDYTYQGRVEIWKDYHDESKGETHILHWTNELIEQHLEWFRAGKLIGSYGKAVVDDIMDHLVGHMDVEDKHVLIVGTQRPWVETLVLEAGAANITTLDYVRIKSDHPKIKTITPQELSKLYLEGKAPQFDAMVTFSSLEHSGLGRYGDSLNPWGDLITMSRVWCLLKPGSRALVGVPSGPDVLTFNAARIYGPIMYSHLFANWNQIYTKTNFKHFRPDIPWIYQPVHIIERGEDQK